MVGNGPETSGRSPQELLEEFEQTGLQGPFEEIVRRYSGMVYQVCFSITKNAHDAEDATQAVFLTLAAQRKVARSIKYVGPWLQQVAYRTSLDMRRSHKRRVAREERAGQIARQDGRLEHAAPEFGAEETRGVLRDELDKLPTKYRLPLILHYFGGLTPGEISKEIGCKPKTLGVRLFRGRKMLRENLAGRGIFVSSAALALAMADMVRESVADHFILSTSHAATTFAANASFGVTTNIVSNQVLTLVRSTARAMLVSKLKWSLALVLLGATAVSSASQLIRHYTPTEIKTDTGVPQAIDAIRALIDSIGRMSPRLMSQADMPTLAAATPSQTEPPAPAPPVASASPVVPTLHATPSDHPAIDLRPGVAPLEENASVSPMMVSTDAFGSSMEISPQRVPVRRTMEQNRAIAEYAAAANSSRYSAPVPAAHAEGGGNSDTVIEVETRSGVSAAAVAAQSGVSQSSYGNDRASSSSASSTSASTSSTLTAMASLTLAGPTQPAAASMLVDPQASIDPNGFFAVLAVAKSTGSESRATRVATPSGDNTRLIGPVLPSEFATGSLLAATDVTSTIPGDSGFPTISNTPEPSSGLLFGLGVASFLLRRRRRSDVGGSASL